MRESGAITRPHVVADNVLLLSELIHFHLISLDKISTLDRIILWRQVAIPDAVPQMKLIAGGNPEVGQIFTEKHVRLHASPEDGTRLLVMRYYPRGVRRDHIDEWIRDLAPSPDLLRWCWGNRDTVDPETFANTWKVRYREEMEQRADLIEEICQRLRLGERITLLCACHDPAKCHRTVLAEIICGIDGRA